MGGSKGFVAVAVVVLVSSVIAGRAFADYHQYYMNSIEWLVENSGQIVIVESDQESTPNSKPSTIPPIISELKGDARLIKWPLSRPSPIGYQYQRPQSDGNIRLLFIRAQSELLEEISLVRGWENNPQTKHYGVTQTGDLLRSPSDLIAAVKARLELKEGDLLEVRVPRSHAKYSGIVAPQYFPLETTSETYVLVVPFDSHLRNEYLNMLRHGDAAQCLYAIHGLSHFLDPVSTEAIRRATQIEDVVPSFRRIDDRQQIQEFSVADVRRKAEQVLASAAEDSNSYSTPKILIDQFGMEFIEIPKGEFSMGSTNGGPNETPHRVKITKSFFLGVTELTERQLHLIRFATGEWDPNEWTLQCESRQSSAYIDSWNTANELARTLSKLDRSHDYRLPTEAEWEYACKGSPRARAPDGENNSVSQNHEPLLLVKAGTPNGFGLYDMLRNNGEFCSDWYAKDFYKRSPIEDPVGPKRGSSRVARGVRSEGRDRSYSCWKRYPLPPEGDSNIMMGVRFVLEKNKD